MLNEGNQTHNFISSSGSDFLTSYGSGSGSTTLLLRPLCGTRLYNLVLLLLAQVMSNDLSRGLFPARDVKLLIIFSIKI